MTTTTARVEVLTAEVRVLMVGSRQVTMSVYSQLDQVEHHDHIEPFGRVAPRDADSDRVYVVGASGRDADRGTLVRASCHTAARLRRAAEGHRLLASYKMAQDADDWPRASELFRQVERLPIRAAHGDWTAVKLRDQACIEDRAARIAASWEALPLIVLAGLR
jgi:hypothetical protein